MRTLNGHTSAVYVLALDDRELFSGSHDKTVKVWSTETLECFHTLRGPYRGSNCPGRGRGGAFLWFCEIQQ